MESPKSKLSNMHIACMVGVAIFFDALQWLMAFVAMDWLVGIFAYMTFGLWFFLKGISLMSVKRASSFFGGMFVEFLPVVSELPATTAMVVMTVLDVKAKESAS